MGQLLIFQRIFLLFRDKERQGQIWFLAMPIIAGMISQNVMNLVDIRMVGTLGDNALAGVGLASFVNFMTVAFLIGLSAAVQTVVARGLGAGRKDLAHLLNASLLIAIAFALPLGILLLWVSPYFFPYLNKDPFVLREALPYFQIRLVAIVGVALNLTYRGYWNGIKLSKIYMLTIIISQLFNIVFNWVFIFGHWGAPALGTYGAGLGTMLATYVGTLIFTFLAFWHARKEGFLRGLPPKGDLLTIVKLSIPAGLQRFFFATGMVVLFWIIGKIGTPELAAINVLINLLLVALLPAIGFGMSATTLVSQALGKKAPDDAMKWGWDVSIIAILVLTFIALPALFFPKTILGYFIHKQSTLELARIPLMLTAATMGIDTLGMVLMHALIGAGDNKRVMLLSTLLQWIFFLPLAYIVGPLLHFGIVVVWAVQVLYRILQTTLFFTLWQRGKWQEIKI